MRLDEFEQGISFARGVDTHLGYHQGQTLMHLDSRCLWGMFSAGCELVDKRLRKVLGWTKN
jgi:propanediol dehydratase large subunit